MEEEEDVLFTHRIVAEVLRRGSLVKESPYIGTWVDPEDRKPHEDCHNIGANHETLKQISWPNLSDTFDGAVQTAGFEVEVRCDCGRWEGRQFRWEGTLDRMIQILLEY